MLKELFSNPEEVKVIIDSVTAEQWLELLTAKDEDGLTPLMYAAMYHTESAKVILGSVTPEHWYILLGLNYENGWMELIFAVNENPEVVKLILDSLTPEHQSEWFEFLKTKIENSITRLMYAALDGPDVFKFILDSLKLEYRLELLAEAATEDRTIAEAVIDMRSESAKVMLDSIPAEQRFELLKAANKDGQTLLMHAVRANLEAVKAIKDSVTAEQWFDLLKAEDKNDQTPLMSAIIGKKPELVQFILDSVPVERKFSLLTTTRESWRKPLTYANHYSVKSTAILLTTATNFSFEERMIILKDMKNPVLISDTVKAFIDLHKEGENIANIIIEVAKLKYADPEEIAKNRNTLDITLKNLVSKDKALFRLVECIATGERPIRSGDARIDELFAKAESFILPEESLGLEKVGTSIGKIYNCSSKLAPAKGGELGI
jgi:ankyrin repeat protein